MVEIVEGHNDDKKGNKKYPKKYLCLFLYNDSCNGLPMVFSQTAPQAIFIDNQAMVLFYRFDTGDFPKNSLATRVFYIDLGMIQSHIIFSSFWHDNKYLAGSS